MFIVILKLSASELATSQSKKAQNNMARFQSIGLFIFSFALVANGKIIFLEHAPNNTSAYDDPNSQEDRSSTIYIVSIKSFYTREVAVNYGMSDLRTKIDTYFKYLNTAFQNSGVRARVVNRSNLNLSLQTKYEKKCL